jgi:hypothetical protein
LGVKAGVYGEGKYGVIGTGDTASGGYGIFSNDDIAAVGTKYFVIDHPKDPANKVLRHACIESPEILNVYRGNIILDEKGEGIVSLPDYFADININFSYHLTPIGEQSVPYIKEKIKGNKFTIAGGKAGQEISWAIYAERNDAYMKKYPNTKIMEYEKDEASKGKYFRPELYNQPKEKGIFYNPDIEARQKSKIPPSFNSPTLNIQNIKNNVNSLKR